MTSFTYHDIWFLLNTIHILYLFIRFILIFHLLNLAFRNNNNYFILEHDREHFLQD